MKYLLHLLLFCSLCNAQEFKNTTKVTVCRLVNSDEAGPCSIQYYAKKLRRTGHYIQAMESNNDTLAYNLLRLKANARNWASEIRNCGEEPDTLGKPLVTNMFIIEINSHKDTVFTTPNNKALFFPKEQLQYIAPDNNIVSIFTKDVDDFFKRDFATEIYKWKMDSISPYAITLLKKAFYGMTRKEFEKEISYFDVVRTDSVFLARDKFFKSIKSYYIQDIKFSFDGISDQLSEVIIENAYTTNGLLRSRNVNLDGIIIGDSEEVLCNKYDNSTSLKNWDAPLAAINNYYTYEVLLDDLQGLVRYTIRNKIIHSIKIEFQYPKGPRKKTKPKK